MAKIKGDLERRPSSRTIYEIPVRLINGSVNPRNPLSSELSKMGWDCMTGDKQIWLLAVSDNAEERAEFVRLIQEHDEEIVSLAATIISQGLLEPVEVCEGGSGKFRLVFGARRCLATLFNWWLLGKPKEPFIQAVLKKGNESTLIHRAVVENIRKPQSYIDEARAIQASLNVGEKKEEIARQLGVSTKTLNNRLELLNLDPKEQQKIHEGKAIAKVKEEAEPINGKDREPPKPPVRKRKEIEAALEEIGKGDARNALEWVLGVREKIS